MALTVATNTGALMAQAAASSVNKEMEISMERLATGKRINGASDDAAGVAIASRLTSEIKGTNQAIRNAMDGQALIDTAEGAHQEIENILQRMRELAVQASNDTNDANDRANLQLEMDQLSTEIDRISSTTSWAGQSLMDGTGSFSFQVGSQTTASDSISASLDAMSTAGLGIGEGGSTTSANAATLIEVGTNVLQAGGTPAEGDVYHFTAGGTDFAVKLGNIGETAVLTPPSSAATNGTAMSFSGNVLTVTAAADGADDTVNVNVNGIDVQVKAIDGEGVDDVAEDLKAAIEAHSEFASMGISITDGDDGTLTFVPTTTYSVSTNGGTSYGNSTTFAANGVEGVSGAIAAAINAQTSSDFVGLTATSASDGSVTLAQAIVFSEASEEGETDAATISADGATLTIDASGVATGKDLTFKINGEAITITADNSDAYTEDELGAKVMLEEKIADNAKLGGLGLAVTIANSTDIVITATAQTTDLIKDVSSVAASTSTATTGLSVATAAGASSAINALDTAIQTLNTQRAELGAISNRLDSTVSNLTNISSNLQAGRGRIEDADFAAETTSLAKAQILQQASTAMLAQANASKQNVLSLLQG
jgi:flagellin